MQSVQHGVQRRRYRRELNHATPRQKILQVNYLERVLSRDYIVPNQLRTGNNFTGTFPGGFRLLVVGATRDFHLKLKGNLALPTPMCRQATSAVVHTTAKKRKRSGKCLFPE